MPSDSPRQHEFDDIAAGDAGGSRQTRPSGNTDEVIEDLSQRLREEQDRRKEERFMFVIVVAILLDATILATTSVWTTPVLVGLLELVGVRGRMID